MESADIHPAWNASEESSKTENDFLDVDDRSATEVILSIFTMGLIIVLSISGNIFVLAAIVRERVLHSKTSIFIASLAIADLINASLNMPTILVSCIYDKWIFGEIICAAIGVSVVTACTASINTLGAIAIDRYFAIVYPFKYSERMSACRVAAILVWIWTQSVLFGLMPAFGVSEFVYIESEYLCSADWSTHLSYTIIIVLVNMGAPIILMTYSYRHIFRIASAHRKQMRTRHNLNESGADVPTGRNRTTVIAFTKRAKQLRQDTKAATTLLIVMGTFLICWLPHTITMLCFAFPSCTAIPEGFYVVSTWFAMLNSACNPFIYCITNKQFRQAFKRTFAQMLPASWKRRMDRRVNPDPTLGTTATVKAPNSNISIYSHDLSHTDDNIHSHTPTIIADCL
ncbi:D(2) dopamine receptor A-like [Strongylocentrotus purpuratus]|uniref:G-protein coupled receptors family 1 profile domain-containing protein n=1 Tax=Strongylocentrotus purpuratus TaxID=7668 RepID=A0A7M7HGM5_STRPU|nr:D(2) dopamine receptor A-like [Strongylocentrotus purpuratus]|eukprot:XP_011666648.1 PREDICTED: D(2) dopamine receptor A-like [Strongylocentrotus purpuratus]